ncbi:ABC transporter ATP-binding protein, partial [Thiohalomonas denitrificans]
MSTPAVRLQDVHKHYGSLRALDGLSLEVGAGEVLGLLGHNGAGKSTTIKLILGLIEATGGEVQVLGRSPCGQDNQKLRMMLGYLPESVRFYEQLSGREVLDYFARLKGVDRKQVGRLFEQVGLAHAADRRVKTYSKGMRQRLGLAQALLGQPKLLLLDEPTVGLDPLATREFYQRVDELRRQGTTVILCSHVLPGIEEHIDRAVILAEGKLRAAGSVAELRRQAELPLTIEVHGHWSDGAWNDVAGQYTVNQI